MNVAPAVQTDTKSFSGNYLVWRKVGDKLRKGTPGDRAGGGNPKFRHASFAAAETEAQRLAGLFPQSSFVILHEVARVKALAVPDVLPPSGFAINGHRVVIDESYDPVSKTRGWAVFRESAEHIPDQTFDPILCVDLRGAHKMAAALSTQWGIPIVVYA